jgi:putative transposase
VHLRQEHGASERRACGLVGQPRSTQRYQLKPKPDDGLHERVARLAAVGTKLVADAITRPNQRWGMDFVSDSLADGRTFRALAIVDHYTRECPAIEVDLSLPGARVVRVLERLAEERGLPEAIRVDNGPEFVSDTIRRWCECRHVRLDYIQPGKPMQNGHAESFNGKFRDECLNAHWFTSLRQARSIIENWRMG